MSELNLKAALKQLDAEGDICDDYKEAIQRILKALCGEKQEEKTYSIGDRFHSADGEHVLAQVAHGCVALIWLAGGNRRKDAIAVSNVHKVTENELAQCAGRVARLTRIEVEDD